MWRNSPSKLAAEFWAIWVNFKGGTAVQPLCWNVWVIKAIGTLLAPCIFIELNGKDNIVANGYGSCPSIIFGSNMYFLTSAKDGVPLDINGLTEQESLMSWPILTFLSHGHDENLMAVSPPQISININVHPRSFIEWCATASTFKLLPPVEYWVNWLTFSCLLSRATLRFMSQVSCSGANA